MMLAGPQPTSSTVAPAEMFNHSMGSRKTPSSLRTRACWVS
ncbi:hypothetical protein I553_8563 [Mycobacterium xenopi 4042]|uniref:Uncharacterized protein n=1 Tax=Mycobacterium xenopi 4042 TaxID=1299334 RepID=X8CMN3_MYCXE|nr:hypothetical protein I553_8563 [Mycobacterium xenopi 4042]